jgi:hypothetical protein
MTHGRFVVLAPALLALTLAATLAACGGGSSDVNYACPSPFTVQDAERLTHFKEGPGRDPRDIAYEAAITASGTSCELTRSQMNVNLIMRITAQAGPSVDPGTTRVPYFVRVLNASGSVVDSREFTADFRLNAANPRGSSQEDLLLTLPYRNISDLGGYRIAIGLKPTREELEYTRRSRGRQGP